MYINQVWYCKDQANEEEFLAIVNPSMGILDNQWNLMLHEDPYYYCHPYMLSTQIPIP
jgi:hypothetical protein